MLSAQDRGSALVVVAMHYVYVLRSLRKANQFYFGFSSNLKRRIEEHNNGKSKATRPYLPWRLVFYEAFLNKNDAERREKYFKTSKGRKTFKLIARESLS